jgi:sec-independent protein translocase protein TatB
MEILGIGASELVFILLIAIIVMGPTQMKQAGRTIGRWLNQMNRSEIWKLLRDTSNEISNLPRKWMREANMEVWEAEQELRNTIDPRTRKPVASQPKPKSFQQAPPPTAAEASPSANETGEESSTVND